jgi:hypothetical protein
MPPKFKRTIAKRIKYLRIKVELFGKIKVEENGQELTEN